MTRGKAPIPKAELQRRGSWRANHRPDDLTLPAKVPSMPRHLDRDARAEWRRLVKLLAPKNVLTEADRLALALLAELTAEDRALDLELDTRVVGTTEWKRIFTARQDVRRQMTAMMVKFGLTPADRTRVTVCEEKESDPLQELLNRQKNRFFNGTG